MNIKKHTHNLRSKMPSSHNVTSSPTRFVSQSSDNDRVSPLPKRFRPFCKPNFCQCKITISRVPKGPFYSKAIRNSSISRRQRRCRTFRFICIQATWTDSLRLSKKCLLVAKAFMDLLGRSRRYPSRYHSALGENYPQF